MKVVIENIVASCKLKGELDLESIKDHLEGARYQPDVFNGITLEKDAPNFKSFILPDGTIKLHGVTSEEALRAAMDHIISTPPLNERGLEEPLKVNEIVASVTLEGPVDAKMIYEEFQKEGIIYDPAELPGFILNVGTTGIEVLIFPEGKIISRGASDLLDAVSSLQMVYNRIQDK